jgi:hypothetical protein
MQEMLRSLFLSKGIRVPEQDYDFLVSGWTSLEQLKKSVEKSELDDFNIALLNIPIGGKEK